MTHSAKIVKGGKIVIPADVRKQLGVVDGDRIVFEKRDDGTFIMRSHIDVVRDIQRSVRAKIKTPFTVDDFIAERRAEADRE
jgi:AbrB family looped-hinge helix DNA binding protein